MSGRKRGLVVDVLGLIIGVVGMAASAHDNAAGTALDGVITIDDAGPGVPPALANSLFERFRSGSGSTGLGLSIAAWVARAHGGTLTLETSPRGGARFALRIPTCGKSTRSASNRPSSASARSADTLCRPPSTTGQDCGLKR
ncbi:sensor histidine kinase [Streptomyces sp. NPDC085929]|uniref:sensor histidine kinase n=1 Tax=Streptomyces sp. NPDC085929 TaxID=3365739 RepID=UPI0037D02637